MDNIFIDNNWLPFAFAFLMALAILFYVILDGYDLGVGILLYGGDDNEKDQMIASIGPFWDANETWLVLGVGILLVAFPLAHGVILNALYLPTSIMLMALILRGVSFDFRTKVIATNKHLWNKSFFAGSLLTALMQGYMLGFYIMGFENSLKSHLFSGLCALSLSAGYSFIGASWLIMKTEGILQKKALKWARISLRFSALGIALVSIVTPLVNDDIFVKWFSIPNIILLAPIPLITIVLILLIDHILKKILITKNSNHDVANDQYAWVAFAGAVAIFILCFHGLAYSFYPYIIPQKMTIYQASASLESLKIIFIGAMIVLPCIVGYTIFAYRVFWGKVKDLKYY
jgi:cytochrome d ubiquinol oxidase subunit II